MEQSATTNVAIHSASTETPRRTQPVLFNRATPYRRSYVNDAVEALRQAGRSLKLQELQASIRDKRGKPVSLGSLKVCLSRYVDTSDSSKLLTRIAPGLFALSEWSNGAMSANHRTSDGNHEDFASMASAFRASSLGGAHSGLPYSSAAASLLFVWTAPADEGCGLEEQRIYIRAANEREAYLRLEFAGVPDSSRGAIRLIELSEAGVQAS